MASKANKANDKNIMKGEIEMKENYSKIDNVVKVYGLEEFKSTIVSGFDHFIGKDEKRRSDSVVHIEFPYTCGNYAMFYKGNQEIFEKACYSIFNILSYNLFNDFENGLDYETFESSFETIINSLHIVHHMNGKKRKSKLNGINSLSTSCCDNTYCLNRMKDGDSICAHCYANAQQTIQLALQDRNTINGVILRNVVIPVEMWKKYFNPANLSAFFRFESFGDVQNKIQAVNYINLSKAFPEIHFAVWTKNTGIWTFAFLEEGKPENLSYIVSSNRVNCPENYHLRKENVNHVFTVYDKNFIEKNAVKINCGGRACLECIKAHKNCYFTDTETEIREELK